MAYAIGHIARTHRHIICFPIYAYVSIMYLLCIFLYMSNHHAIIYTCIASFPDYNLNISISIKSLHKRGYTSTEYLL